MECNKIGQHDSIARRKDARRPKNHYSVRLFFGTTKEIGRMMNEIIQTVVLNSISKKKGFGFYLIQY
jgi:hypothetical protein